MAWMEEKTIRDLSKSLSESSVLLDKRLAIFSEFQKVALPTMRDEDWRYTNIKKIKWDSYDPSQSKQTLNVKASGKIVCCALR